ncbi:MAG: phenylalanine--tRNA ligase subunit beta, partial [Bacteroidetes bacterium]|nr:phenylalanine--tRNA ligase subunit beta [Bacteroidota bacterium]
LETVAYNVNTKQADLKLFEFGKTYHKQGAKYVEKSHLCVYMTGAMQAESWFVPAREVKFHDLAAAVQQVLTAMKVKGVETVVVSNGIMQTGLEYTLNKKTLVSLGLVRAGLTKKAGLKTSVWYADFDWDYLLKQYNAAVQFREVPRFPEVRRDLSLVLDKAVTFAQLHQLAFRTEKQLLKEVNVFDVFEGESLQGKKAYALSFIIQDTQQTLTDKVIDKVMQRLMATFERELGAIIRK